MRAIALFMVLVVPAVGAAAVDADASGDADAYCSWVKSATRSQSAPLLSPQLFLNYGIVNGDDASTGTGGMVNLPPTQRLTVGLRYSLISLWQGVELRKRASAECERYRAVSQLHRFMQDNREQVSPAALDAKIAVLRAAVPKARELVRSLKAAVDRARATVEELQAAQVRADALAATLGDTEALRAGLPPRGQIGPPDALIRKHQQYEAEVEKHEARLRVAQALDLSVRGGYDRFFGIRDDVPVFAVVSLTINPAVLYQPFADDEARKARVRWVASQNAGIDQRVELLANRLKAVRDTERRRLQETRALLADVESRLRTVDSIDSERLRRFRDATWFDYVRLKADFEFLRVHVAELDAALGAW